VLLPENTLDYEPFLIARISPLESKVVFLYLCCIKCLLHYMLIFTLLFWADLKDLISTLGDNHGECSVASSYKTSKTDSICPSRVRAMLASRACRSSVMIGDPLRKNEMQKVTNAYPKINNNVP